jgi:hypothetical protein
MRPAPGALPWRSVAPRRVLSALAPAGLARRDGAEVHPVMTQHYTMLQRNLLHNGVTRGKRVVVLVARRRRSLLLCQRLGAAGSCPECV